MARGKTTSRSVARKASRLLRTSKSKIVKSVAASALSQRSRRRKR